ncbi:protein shisa-4 [Microcaecilia unicolor]|uniref:Protein shisa-4 n=1 Tax=Microcaecilia unicolor TaxID=1415580 RepID=A0A6P7ZLA6_9AMPH|nr:protein shisa-4 [Microcaecilia unicolor]
MRESVPGALAAAGILLCAFSAYVAADEDCLGYLDKDGKWRSGFDCKFISFCCGNCLQRYCCIDPMNLITERQQKHCVAFSPKMIAGVASAVLLFIGVISTAICCFMCSCCYLYQRRHQQRSTHHQGQEMQMMGYPAEPSYPVQPGYPIESKPGPAPPYPGYAPVSVYPPGPPVYNPAGAGEGYPPYAPSVQYPMYPPGPTGNPTAPSPYVPPQSMYPGP